MTFLKMLTGFCAGVAAALWFIVLVPPDGCHWAKKPWIERLR